MSIIPKKTVIIVAGPTAVGKTAVAIKIARHFNTKIISADSRQCFSEMNIGVARPSAIDLQTIPHHFIASHSIQEEVTAAGFEQYALEKSGELFKRHDTIVLTGGTGLYIRAFCEGLDEIPAIPAETRSEISLQYNQQGIGWLQKQLQIKDPQFYREGEMQNPQRMMRALEVVVATGSSILAFRNGIKKQRPFHIIKIGLELSREELRQRIDARVDSMMEAGLLDEVTALFPYRNLNALQTVGYSELFDFLENKLSLAEAIDQIKIHTRQYAKRQMTWFKKDSEIKWYSPHDTESILAGINSSR